VLALGSVVAVGGALAGPAFAYHYDPVTKQWVIDCTKAPPFDSNKAQSGWQVFAGDQYQGKVYVGARSNDPYVVGYVDPNAKRVTVGAWQPWHDANFGVPGVTTGPWFFDQSVTVSPNTAHPEQSVQRCNTSVHWPPANTPVPVPNAVVYPGAAAGPVVRFAR
jgi:hypothetical protein